ncbi:MAG: recombinase family protein, partial [Thermoanaerobaculia bacterium]
MIQKTEEVPRPKSPVVNVAFYCRVSTDRQAEKEDGSLDTQLDRLTSLVDYRRKQGDNWSVAEKLVEGEKDGKRRGKSAKNTDRPAYQKLLELARARLIDVVVVTKLDRISRSLSDFVKLVEELERYGVRLVSLKENFDFTTAAGRFQIHMLVALAQYERELTSARVKDKVLWRLEKGLPIGPPPGGYVMNEKTYAPLEPCASHVRAADALYLERESTDVIVKEFVRLGYRTKSGSAYSKPVIWHMLRSPIYAAKQEHEGKVYEAGWKPIRTWETHEKIQRLMDRNNQSRHGGKTQPRNYVYLLQSLLRCGECGYKMVPQPATGRNGIPYHYYGCNRAQKSAGTACPKRYVPAEAIDRAVLAFMKELHLKPERIKAIAAKENGFASETITKLKEDYERVSTQLGKTKQQLTHLTEVLANGGISALATIKEKLETLEGERSEMEATQARLKAELGAEESQEIAVDAHVKSLAVFEALVSEHADEPERIKSAIQRFVDYVVWHA